LLNTPSILIERLIIFQQFLPLLMEFLYPLSRMLD